MIQSPCHHFPPALKQTFLDTIPALRGWRGWRTCVDSFTQDSQLRKYIAECDSLITIEEVKKLRTSMWKVPRL